MCFSAPASFTASAILGAMGAALISRVKDKSLLPIAMIPCFFALQQGSEGIIWLKLSNMEHAKNIYLFFAYVFWPIWIPFSLYFAEKNPLKKQVLSILLGIGVALACILFLVIPESKTVFYDRSVRYLENTPFDLYSNICLLFYGLAGLLPFFISSVPRIWGVGLLMLLAGIATFTIERVSFVSLWCFWSALISMSLFFVVYKKRS